MQKLAVAIIGGGLSGLYTARLLANMNIDFQLFEGRHRLGGRIESTPENGPQHDLGPAWLWPDFQPRMAALVQALGLNLFRQHSEGDMLVERFAHQAARRIPGFESASPSMRIGGGMQQLVKALAASIDPKRVFLNARVVSMQLNEASIMLRFDTSQNMQQRHFTHVITAMPLRLLAQDIIFEPALSGTTIEHWFETPTWMAPHAKYVALYDSPFWRAQGLSGMAQSHLGPMVEIHDASDSSASAALFGFLGVPATERQMMNDATLLEQCRLQLVRLFGEQAAKPGAHYLKDWAADPLTATHRDHEAKRGHFSRPHAKPIEDAWSARLLVAGTEASFEHNGYMEGALDAAEFALGKFLKLTL
ncbi:FAD-dependent oxidoreductase [Pseudomonas reactans]|nr:FAD-dependent oxidoreductase [Pseudomonas reactans]